MELHKRPELGNLEVSWLEDKILNPLFIIALMRHRFGLGQCQRCIEAVERIEKTIRGLRDDP